MFSTLQLPILTYLYNFCHLSFSADVLFSWKWKRAPVVIIACVSLCAIVLCLPFFGNIGGEFKVEEKIFGCTLSSKPKLGLMEILVVIGFLSAVLVLIFTNVYIQYKTKICEVAINRYLGEQRNNLSEDMIKKNQARCHLESEISYTVLILMVVNALLLLPGMYRVFNMNFSNVN